jgi:hypothetical protein
MWPTMNKRFPQDASLATVEGDAAHWVAWEMLAGRTPELRSITPNAQAVTEEMLDGAELLVETIRSQIKGEVAVERKIACHSIHAQCDGTPDAWGLDNETRTIHIIDYKFGHRFVDEFWNDQGLAYLSGIVDLLLAYWKKSYAEVEPYLNVRFTIVQPRCYQQSSAVRTHAFKLSEVRTHFNRLANAAEAAMMAAPKATTNKHCGDCHGRHACPALQEAAYNAGEYSSQRNIVELQPAAAALELLILSKALARLKARVSGLEEMTLANLKAGLSIPYYRAESTSGRTTWNVPDSQVISLGKIYGCDLSKPGTRTPTQAKAMGIDPTMLQQFSMTPSGAMKLVEQKAFDAVRVFQR